MANRERIIVRNRFGQAVWLRPYNEDGSKVYTDLDTDGRFLLDPVTARKLADKLREWAKRAEAKERE